MKRVILSLIVNIFLITNLIESKLVSEKSRSKNYSPVILVPGDGGSQIQAKLNKPKVVHFSCESHTDYWYNLWLEALEFLPTLSVDCFIDNLKLEYDNATRTTSNSPGVQTRIPGWGDPEAVEVLDPSDLLQVAIYLKDITDALVYNLGYKRELSVKAAPYDFRKAPNENKNWFVDMKELVEETYRQNKNKPVTLIVHSMGGPMSLLFLQQQTSAWKEKYIARMISLAGAWAGTVHAVRVFAMGDNMNFFFVNASVMRTAQISFPSTAWLLPSPLFWKDDEVLVETPSRSYTISQLQDFFRDIDYPTGWEMRKDTIKYSLDFSPPDVEVHCLYGSKIPTVEKLRYHNDDLTSSHPQLITGNGDGTLNIRTLKACDRWKAHQTPNVTSLELPGVSHLEIFRDQKVISYILDVLSKKIDSEL